MQIKGVSAGVVRAIVNRVSYEHYRGNLTFNREPETKGSWVHFTLYTHDCHEPGANIGAHRRTRHACWHAHRDVLAALFAHTPDARIETAMATYTGERHFYDTFGGTGYLNRGSAYEPRPARECCDCNVVVDAQVQDLPNVSTTNVLGLTSYMSGDTADEEEET